MLKQIQRVKLDLRMDGQMLDRVFTYKYLGITVDDHLNYNKHLMEMKKIVSHKLFMFSKIKYYIRETDAILFFKTMILPVMEYCDIIYEGTSAKNLAMIDKLFKQGSRICLRNRVTTVTNEIEMQKICQI